MEKGWNFKWNEEGTRIYYEVKPGGFVIYPNEVHLVKSWRGVIYNVQLINDKLMIMNVSNKHIRPHFQEPTQEMTKKIKIYNKWLKEEEWMERLEQKENTIPEDIFRELMVQEFNKLENTKERKQLNDRQYRPIRTNSTKNVR